MLADAAGKGDDFDALFVNDAEPLAVTRAERRLTMTSEATADRRARVLGRRQLLRTGGLDGLARRHRRGVRRRGRRAEPGRVGYAPPATPPADGRGERRRVLRTATSIEHTILDVYATITELGALDGEAQALVDRLVEDHTGRRRRRPPS